MLALCPVSCSNSGGMLKSPLSQAGGVEGVLVGGQAQGTELCACVCICVGTRGKDGVTPVPESRGAAISWDLANRNKSQLAGSLIA